MVQELAERQPELLGGLAARDLATAVKLGDDQLPRASVERLVWTSHERGELFVEINGGSGHGDLSSEGDA